MPPVFKFSSSEMKTVCDNAIPSIKSLNIEASVVFHFEEAYFEIYYEIFFHVRTIYLQHRYYVILNFTSNMKRLKMI